jgi:hypothetical protein
MRQPTIQHAQARARRLWPRNRAFQAVYVRGWRARRAKVGAGACPYDTKLHGKAGNATWALVFRKVWMEGWLDGEL